MGLVCVRMPTANDAIDSGVLAFAPYQVRAERRDGGHLQVEAVEGLLQQVGVRAHTNVIHFWRTRGSQRGPARPSATSAARRPARAQCGWMRRRRRDAANSGGGARRLEMVRAGALANTRQQRRCCSESRPEPIRASVPVRKASPCRETSCQICCWLGLGRPPRICSATVFVLVTPTLRCVCRFAGRISHSRADQAVRLGTCHIDCLARDKA